VDQGGEQGGGREHLFRKREEMLSREVTGRHRKKERLLVGKKKDLERKGLLLGKGVEGKKKV